MDHAKALLARKDELEQQIEEIQKYLSQPHIAHFRVVDDQGFPNENVELIYSIRSAQHKLACTYFALH